MCHHGPSPSQSGSHRIRFEDRWREGPLARATAGLGRLDAAFRVPASSSPIPLARRDWNRRGLRGVRHPYLMGQLVEVLRKLSLGELGPRPVQILLATHSAEPPRTRQARASAVPQPQQGQRRRPSSRRPPPTHLSGSEHSASMGIRSANYGSRVASAVSRAARESVRRPLCGRACRSLRPDRLGLAPGEALDDGQLGPAHWLVRRAISRHGQIPEGSSPASRLRSTCDPGDARPAATSTMERRCGRC